MNYRPWLERPVLERMDGLPLQALDTVIQALARICENPYDRLLSMPLTGRPGERVAELGDAGWLEFVVDDAAGLIRVHALVWLG